MDFPTQRLNEIIKANEGLISICGDFGVGKTTFVLQTAINSAKLGNKVLYFYSKPNFPSQRIGNILKDNSMKVLDNLTFTKIIGFNELISAILNLEFFILENLKESGKKLSLLVIDSLTELYRLELNKEKKEKNTNLNYQLNQILGTLTYILETYGIEILIVNELSRKRKDDEVFEVQGGGKIMDFWMCDTVKLMRTEVLSERNLIVRKVRENKIFEVKAKLTKYGFD